MAKKTELIGNCGLYCYECPSYTQKTANLAKDLQKQLRKDKFDKHSDMIAQMPGFEAFKHYEQGIELLGALQKIRCKGCKPGGWDGTCKVRKCVKKKNYKGCWQCEIFESCEKLKPLEDGKINLHLKNLRKIRKIGPSAFVKAKSK